MPDAPPNLDEVKGHLLDEIQRVSKSRDAIAASDSECDEYFVPQEAIEPYFRENRYEQTARILRALFTSHPTIRARDLAEHCPRVCCILAKTDHLSLITHFVNNGSLWDRRLPFEPQTLRSSLDTDDDFIDKFCYHQWQFCAPLLQDSWGVKLEDKFILPFIEWTHKDSGFTSEVYKAVVHNKHDQLNHAQSSVHTYAVKIYKGSQARENYERELAAFKRITEAGIKSAPGIVGMYGSFEYREHFGVNLEFAECTLEQHLRSINQLTEGSEILAFWQGLLGATDGLNWLHNHRLSDSAGSDGLSEQGWHQDLKPANILLVRKGSDSGYRDLSFKIADFGLSCFKMVSDKEGEASAHWRWGTRTYGAPECYATANLVVHQTNKVKRSIDIWSLGCILSEAAVCVVWGSTGLKAYQDERSFAISQIQRLPKSDAFHNGHEVLDVVTSKHDELRKEISSDDYITGWVIEEMVTNMLNENSDSRPHIQLLVGQKNRRINKAHADLQKKTDREAHSSSSPPISPFGIRFGGPSGAEPTAAGGDDPVFSAHVNAPDRFDARQYQRNPLNPSDRNGPVTTNRFTRSHTAVGVVTSRPQQEPHRGFGSLIMGRTPPSAVPAANDRSATQQRGTSPLNGSIAMDRDSTIGVPQPGQSRAESTPTVPPTKVKQPIPPCSVDEAKAWYDKRKYSDRKATLPHHQILQCLDKHDFIFVIDDSNSMRPHWTELINLIKPLVHILKKMDPDGCEMLFLSSGKRHKVKSAADAYLLLRNHQADSLTNLGILNDEISAYMDKYESRTTGMGRLLGGPRKRCVYIFTDGILGADDAKQGQEAIKMLYQKAQRRDMIRGQFGIQFISFGNDKQGLRKLRELDHLSRRLDFYPERDFVDTERSDGNVFKMLLGAVNSLFDDDDDDNEDDDGGGGDDDNAGQRVDSRHAATDSAASPNTT